MLTLKNQAVSLKKKEQILKDKQKKLASLEAQWIIKSAKMQGTDERLKASRTETVETIQELR